jgi:DNA-binding response OmpR family regulator
VVIDAGAHLEVASGVKRARQVSSLTDIPVLLCTRCSASRRLDPELGVDDFVLSPIVGSELYARVRPD